MYRSDAKTLYIIGNGFDLYHGAESSYWYFREYLLRCAPEVVMSFDLYFGPKNLWRSFRRTDDFIECLLFNKNTYPEVIWTGQYLWSDFEKYLSELNREKVLTILDFYLPKYNTDDDRFSYSDYFLPIERLREQIYIATFEMKFRFHKWINTLNYKRGFRRKMLSFDENSLFLNFNYTLFLESEYKIPNEQICYIHGSRKDKYGSLVLGHNDDIKKSFNTWYHKCKNQKRFRPNLKDNKGRWYANDKMTYLAYFLDDETKGNWRLPIRYYAQEEVVCMIEEYYEQTLKETHKIISKHKSFFDSIKNVEKIVILGHSLADVDMPYFDKIMNCVDKNKVRWEISYHTEKDLERISYFCKKYNISARSMFL
jgi:hypothetical protein